MLQNRKTGQVTRLNRGNIWTALADQLVNYLIQVTGYKSLNLKRCAKEHYTNQTSNRNNQDTEEKNTRLIRKELSSHQSFPPIHNAGCFPTKVTCSFNTTPEQNKPRRFQLTTNIHSLNCISGGCQYAVPENLHTTGTVLQYRTGTGSRAEKLINLSKVTSNI